MDDHRPVNRSQTAHERAQTTPVVAEDAPDAPAEIYRQRARDFQQRATRATRWDRRLTATRAALFLAGAACLGVALAAESQRTADYFTAAAAIGLVFLVVITVHESIRNALDRFQELQRINEQLGARLLRDWDEFPCRIVEVPGEHAAVARDLDVFGRRSLFHFLCQAHTPLGIETLRDWLLNPASPAEVDERQRSVRELGPLVELREQLVLRGRQLSTSTTGPQKFIAWAEGEPWLAARPWLAWITRLLPILFVCILILVFTSTLPAQEGGMTLLGLLAANFLLCVLFNGRVHDIFHQISTRNGEVRQYLAMFGLLYELPVTSKGLVALREEATVREGGVLARLRQVGRIVHLADMHHSPVQFLLWLFLQLLLLWDFHVLALLEWWRRRTGHRVRAWFRALGELEALASLAGIAHDHPAWAFPRVDGGAETLAARGLGHPLLAETARVCNDVEVGPAGTLLLVTGSNMSGKSTLLRSLGVNAILAQAGAPVCAIELRIPPVRVTTSMRIHDSLADGVSFYFAELRRLKQIVDQAVSFRDRPDQRLLYLLDEILQGTNSRERHIAVECVLAHLISQRAFGAVSTHDLELASSEVLSKSCRAVHFRETLVQSPEGQTMTFDYRMRPGVATTTNALKLLEMVGLSPSAR